MSIVENGRYLIAGPCAAESRQQVLDSARIMKERGIPILRASLWKPRTNPGFDGVGAPGIPWLVDAVKTGITVATEIMLPEQGERVVQALLEEGHAQQVLVWIGARNQNHLTQKRIAQAVKDRRVKLMLKNPMHKDESHWLGVLNHVVQTGFPYENILFCHRGYAPNGSENPQGYRNLPDWEGVQRFREETGFPMIIDPSHIGGSVPNVFQITQEALQYHFDGFITEVHPNPAQALTDRSQQLNIEQFDQWLQLIADWRKQPVATKPAFF